MWLGTGLLTGCGGGGGGAGTSLAGAGVGAGADTAGASPDLPQSVTVEPGSGAAGEGAPPPAQQLQALSPHIACWGDSITDLYAPTLQRAYPDRQVHNGGVIGETSMQITARLQADSSHRSWITILWYGHNNWDKDQVKADIAASIASLATGNEAFVVLSMLNWAGSGERGTQEYTETMRVNGELAAQYPEHYLDMHRYLVNLYDPNSWQDVQDFQNDLPPSSLRFDRIHLNEAGCRAVTAKLREFIESRGW